MDVRIQILLRVIHERSGVLALTSRELGSLLGLSETRILRLFNAETGKPLRSYIREVKMKGAAELLKDCLIPIKTIASRCGYSAVSNFYRDFKLVHGTSPKQMRSLQMGQFFHGTLSRMVPVAALQAKDD